MHQSRTTTGIFLVVVLAVVGYMLWTMPYKLVDGYAKAADLNPWIGYVYLAVVGIGGLLLAALLISILLHIWKNTRRKSADRERRNLNPSEMSAAQQSQEFADNLAAGREYASGDRVSPELRAEIASAVDELEAKRETQQLEIVAFGTISSGKSSLLNALAGRPVFRTNVVGGTTSTRSEIPWPAGDRVTLVDTPGLAEVKGEVRAAESAEAAKNADLVLFVVDGPLKSYESELLDALAAMEKRIVVCLNKEDWYDALQRDELLKQIGEQVAPAVHAADVVAVRSRPTKRRRVRVLSDGAEQEEEVPVEPDIGPLARRTMSIIGRDGRDLLLANLLLQSRGLVDESKERVLAALDERANEVINKYMWAAGGATALNPFPLLDLAGGSAITVKMVLDLAGVYQQKIDADTIITLLGQLGKNLVAMVGASAAAPALAVAIGSMLKTVPGIGTIAGGAIQGLVQALVTRWIGRVFCEYFRNEMQPPPGGLAELARRQWAEVTRPEQLRKLIQLGRERLMKSND
ncbi:MAG: GTP-binding protein [Planctomycetes bacterium]|nr:GTP-binding protein [Planctomycetota bacterium]